MKGKLPGEGGSPLEEGEVLGDSLHGTDMEALCSLGE